MAPWPQGVGRRVLDEIDSTMLEAARAAPGLMGPEWVMALHQTAARGRRGRPWAMPPGNFAASLTLMPTEPPAVVALRSFVASLALLRALVTLGTPPDVLALKWPNDVLLNGGKLAGILLESLGDGQGRVRHLIIGIGVNLARAPDISEVEPGAVPPVSLLDETGLRIAPEPFLSALAVAYDALERQFVTYGFAPIRTAWMSHAARLGQVITARIGETATSGTFRDVDGSGNLILETPAGVLPIAAADIFF